MSNKTAAFYLTILMTVANYIIGEPKYFLGSCIFVGVYLILDNKK